MTASLPRLEACQRRSLSHWWLRPWGHTLPRISVTHASLASPDGRWRWLRDIEVTRLGTPVRPPRRVYCRGQRVMGQPKRTTAHRAFVECGK